MGRILAGFVGGLLYWLLTMILATLAWSMTDSWAAPTLVSLPAVILIPITGILFSIPSTVSEMTRMRKAEVARVLVLLILALDVAFVAITISQADHLVDRIMFWPDLSFLLFLGCLWAVPWVYWHYIAIRIALKRMP